MKHILFIIFFFQILFGWSQQTVVDSLLNELNVSTDTTKAKLYNQLSWELKYTKPDTALYFALQSYQLSDSIKFDRGKADALHKIGIILWVEGKLNEAIDSTKSAIILYEKLKNKKSVAGCVNNLGAIYSSQGNYKESLKNYQLSYTLKSEIHDSIGMVSSLTNIGNINVDNKEFTEAIKYYMQSLDLSLKISNVEPYKIVDIYNNLGLAYRNIGQTDSSLFYYRQNIALCKQNNLLMPYSKGLSNIGTLFFKINEMDSAMIYYQEAYKIQKTINTIIHLGRTTTNIAEVYRVKKQYALALKYAKEAEGYVFQSSALKEQQMLYHLFSDLYLDLGDYKNAHYYLTKYEVLHDSLVNTEKSKEIAKLDALYQFEKKEKEIELLKKDNELKKNQRDMQRLYKNIAFSGVLIALVLIILIINRLRINKKLFKQKEELITAKEEETRLHLENEKLEKKQLLAEQKLKDEEFKNREIITQIQTEKLKSELELKNRELSSSALAAIQKNELLDEIESQIKKLEQNPDLKIKPEIRGLKLLVKEKSNIDNDWENFKIHFDSVHPDFYKKLLYDYTDLSQNDLKHCTYIKVKLSSKDIAKIMNISPKSVQMSRYRLKKKFNLAPEDDLISFIEML